MEKDLSNHEKLGILFELYEQKLYQVAFSILHNEYDAEDVVADTYEKILQCLGKIGNPNSRATRRFLIKITKNKAIDRYRNIQKNNKHITDIDNKDIVDEDNNIELCLRKNENRDFVKNLKKKLSDKSYEILMLRCIEEMSFDEIATTLNISSETARKRYERARKESYKCLREV